MSALDFLERAKKPTTLCAFCPKMCRFSCPVAESERREAVTPGAKMSLLDWAGRGHTTLREPDEVQALEACTDCGKCQQYCTHDNPVAETLAMARGALQTERAQRYAAAFAETGDVKGRDAAPVLAALNTRHPARESARVGYFPGCQRMFHTPEKMDEDLALLEAVGGEDVTVCALQPKRHCCGYPLLAEGLYEAYDAYIADLAETLRGYDVVVTPDPGCAHALTERMTKRGQVQAPNVVSLTEHLDTHRAAFAGRADGLRVRYHDACYLGRHRGIYDAPRRLLEAACGTAPDEFAACKDDAVCSGSGGLYPASAPEGSRNMAARVVSHDPHASASDIVVTACPSARRGFARAGVNAVELGDVLLGRVGSSSATGGGGEHD